MVGEALNVRSLQRHLAVILLIDDSCSLGWWKDGTLHYIGSRPESGRVSYAISLWKVATWTLLGGVVRCKIVLRRPSPNLNAMQLANGEKVRLPERRKTAARRRRCREEEPQWIGIATAVAYQCGCGNVQSGELDAIHLPPIQHSDRPSDRFLITYRTRLLRLGKDRTAKKKLNDAAVRTHMHWSSEDGVVTCMIEKSPHKPVMRRTRLAISTVGSVLRGDSLLKLMR
ncbi:hypothetical protein BDW22DRAFT_1341731 [Trametopsis cervina]|nr:hypothetical protein BDW22DRAFT_1341731 [Trametopsis cervina]